MKEGKFQTEFRKRLEQLFPGCLVFKTHEQYRQGTPDLFMVWGLRWAAFEVKRDAYAHIQPNQVHYIDLMDDMSFAAIVYPENVEEVLGALQRSFQN